ITSVAALHANEKEFIVKRFEGLSEFSVSLYDTILYLSYLIFGIITGILADRFAKRRIFILIGSAVSAVFLFLLTLAGQYWLLLILRFIQGAFTVMVWQMLMTMILDISTKEHRGRNMGIYGALLALGFGMGPMLGGFLAKVHTFAPYYVASGLVALVFILSLAILREAETAAKRPTIVDSLLIVKKYPRIVIPGLFNFVDRFTVGFMIFLLPFFIEEKLGLSSDLRGVSLAIFALPFILLQFPMGKLSDKIGRYIPLIFGNLCFCIILPMVGYFGSSVYAVLLVLLALLGVFSGISAPSSMALIGDFVKKEDNAMAMGFFNFLGNLGVTLGPLVGSLYGIYGYNTTYLSVGIGRIVMLVILVLLIFLVFKEKLQPSPKEVVELNSTE
ncbi:MAG: MFS transporter, partial [Candidatus Heimdallarchaeota archaeon]